MSTLTIRIDEKLDKMLDEASERSGMSKSDVVREALRRQLLIQEFRAIRAELMPYAERNGIITDEDVFNII